jgi:glutathione S-transferase
VSDEAVLYAVPGSHPSHTGQLMLELKGIPFRRVNLAPGFHRVYVRMRGFPGDRVPAVRFADGSRAQGTRPLARALDAMNPEPRLVPDDLRAVEAERWAEDVLQLWARRMVIEAALRDPELLDGRGARGRLGPLLFSRDRLRRLMVPLVKRAYGMTVEQFRDDLARTPELLDHVDELIAAGVLGGQQLSCADLQVATCLAVVEYRLDVREQLDGRPAAQLLERVLPASG